MTLPLTLVLSLLGCSQVQELLGQSPPPPPPVQDVKPAEAPKPKVTATLLQAGKFTEALPELEKALAATPTDDAAWDAVEIAAVRGGQAAALLDRLSVDQAIGGRVDRHQALRAELALVAGRAPDALAAARALEPANAGDSAALTVRAIQAGAAKPDGLPPVVEAFVKSAMDKTDKPVAFPPEVDALPGARAALLRAEIKAAHGDAPGALLALDSATATGLLGTRVALARAGWETDHAKGWATTTAGVDSATKAQDLVGAAMVLDAGKIHAYRQWKVQAVADAAAGARKGCEELENAAAAAMFAGVQADALMHLGTPIEAKAAAEVAAAGGQARGKWRLALANAMLGDARGATAAAAGLSDADAQAIKDLGSAMAGGKPTLPTKGLAGDEAAWQLLLAAGWTEDRAAAATAAAAAAQSPDLALWGTLWSTRAPVTGAPETPMMASENAVRAWVRDGTPGAVVDSSHPFAGHWRIALSHGTAPVAEGDIAAYARLVSSIEGAFADQAGNEMNELSAVLPDWRSGPLGPLLTLDGPQAAELEGLATSPSRLTDEDALGLRVSWHAWRQRELDRNRLWAHGVSPVPPALGTPEKLAALWQAVAKQRAAVLAWAAGVGAYPTASVSELDNVAVELRLLPRKAGTVDDIRSALGRSALLSFVPARDGGWEALYLTDHGYRHAHLPATVAKETSDYLAGLRGGKVSVAAGNKLREALVDPAADLLTGYGNYYVVGPAPLGALPVDALPEQSEGLRYLASIRHTFYFPNFGALTPPTFQENDFATTMLAVVGDAASAETIKRIFPDAVVLDGAAATRDAWLKEAPRARFLAFSHLEAAPSGGFVMPAGGTLDLSDIASTPLVARTVSVNGNGDAATTLARLSAVRAAGAGDFFATSSGANKAFNEKMTERFWDSTNKRLPVWKAMSEPRMQIAAEIDAERGAMSPTIWGAVMTEGKLQ